jgi:hypothetical protein
MMEPGRRNLARRLPLFLVALAVAAFAASALAGSFAAKASFVFNGSIDVSTDPYMSNVRYATGRTNCSGFGAGAILSGNYHYKVYRFRNLSSVQRCVTVGLAVTSGTAAVSGYISIFDPSDSNMWFAGSAGGFGVGQSGDFEYNIAAGKSEFDVVVWETCGCGISPTYTLLVEGVGVVMTGGGTPTAVASLDSFRASAAPKATVVRWRTRSEHDALGFNLYRGDTKKVRLTRSIVRAFGDGRGHTYSYIDRAARKGKAGRYWLQVVQRGGSKIMFGPAAR